MKNFFSTLIESINMILLFIGNMVNSLLNATSLIANLPGFCATLIGQVPAIIGASITIVLAIGVVKLVLGWGNS
jgi:hypothetical protein